MPSPSGVCPASQTTRYHGVRWHRPGGARHPLAQTRVTRLATVQIQVSDQITQAFPTGERFVGQEDESAPSGELARPMVGLVLVETIFKMHEVHDCKPLCNKRVDTVHNGNLSKRGGGTQLKIIALEIVPIAKPPQALIQLGFAPVLGSIHRTVVRFFV